MTTKHTSFLAKYFYFFMSLLIAAVVAFGFSSTLDQGLIHTDVPPSFVLYIRAAIYVGWVTFFILQSALVRTHNVRVHRFLGWFGVALGAAVIVLGVWTTIVMARFRVHHFHSSVADLDLLVPLFDMVCFTIAFALAIDWRKDPEFHRRLMLVATCVLTAAAFSRFPARFGSQNWFYAGTDYLILLGVARDLILDRRIHRVYLYALPTLILGQSIVMYAVLRNPPLWLKIATNILH